MTEVAVIGAGPAGWAAAAAFAQQGLSVRLIAPDPLQPFVNGYGVWADELAELMVTVPFSRTWPSARVYVSESDTRSLKRVYGRIDNQLLQARLLEIAQGCEVSRGHVTAINLHSNGFIVRTEDGQTMSAGLVVDASGHRSALIRSGEGPPPGWQVALGWRIRTKKPHPWSAEEAVLMDFRLPDTSDAVGHWPSFLYALPENSRTVFVEETSLVRRPAVSIEDLRVRLQARLSRLGVEPVEILEEERCFIPMGGPEPPPSQPIVAFGGAARMVHPSSGYMLARVLRTAPKLAVAVKSAFESGASLEERSRRAWASIWPSSERVADGLLRFGTEVLIGMDTSETRAFFSAFFSLPSAQWQAYLSGVASPSEVRKTMLGVFSRVSWVLKWRLTRAAIGTAGRPFRAALFRNQ